MILSALFTSVGINLGLCALFFALYSVLRKQPGNVRVYASRLVVEGKAQRMGPFDIERLLPSAGWIRNAWQPSEDDLLSVAGLDAVVFMRIFIFSLKVFSVAGIIGIFILLPINYEGDQLHTIDFANLANESLEKFNISNIHDGSKWSRTTVAPLERLKILLQVREQFATIGSPIVGDSMYMRAALI